MWVADLQETESVDTSIRGMDVRVVASVVLG